jgi:outer membrane protein assembly factor BamB
MKHSRIWIGSVTLSLVFAGAALSATAVPGSAAGTPPDAPAGSATTYQVNPSHDGGSSTELKAPLRQAWSHDFGAQVSYPLIVNGRVFVTTSQPGGPSSGPSLWALNATTGAVMWGPIALGGADALGSIAADGQNVYGVNLTGTLRAVSQATGTEVWSQQLLGQSSFTSPPTVRNGTLYVVGAGTAGTLYAVDPANGAVRWTAPVTGGDHSSPAVTADQVIVQSACALTEAFNPTDGSQRWRHVESCVDGAGRTPVLNDDKVYVRAGPERGRILEAATGAKAGTYSAVTTPVFAGGRMFTTTLGAPGAGFTLTGFSTPTGWVRWTQVGDGHLVTAPLAIGDSIAIGSSSGRVALFDTMSGVETWSANAGSPILAPDEDTATPLVGLSTSGDLLLVPATNTLVAYRSSPSRATTHVRLTPSTASQFGASFWLHATVPAADGGTASFYGDGDATPLPGCAAVPLKPATDGRVATCGVRPSFGAHTFTVRYSGDAAHAPSSVTISHAVVRAKTHYGIGGYPATTVDGVETQKIWAQLYGFQDIVAGRRLRFTRDGVALCNRRTNFGGTATCVVRTGGPVLVTFAGTAHYLPSSIAYTPNPTH